MIYVEILPSGRKEQNKKHQLHIVACQIQFGAKGISIFAPLWSHYRFSVSGRDQDYGLN